MNLVENLRNNKDTQNSQSEESQGVQLAPQNKSSSRKGSDRRKYRRVSSNSKKRSQYLEREQRPPSNYQGTESGADAEDTQ